MALARADGTKDRFNSLAAQIAAERRQYYLQLAAAQRGNLDITAWLAWFIGCLDRAILGADMVLARVLRKAKLWRRINRGPMNERQSKVINRLLDADQATNSLWVSWQLVDLPTCRSQACRSLGHCVSANVFGGAS